MTQIRLNKDFIAAFFLFILVFLFVAFSIFTLDSPNPVVNPSEVVSTLDETTPPSGAGAIGVIVVIVFILIAYCFGGE
jgi:protein-S-isoprenylcysteine O-methyltransferase Ste14